ncbi:MAG: GspE/PulE family protein [Candidatus Absconditabacterales bacterium]|nr:GspE/PulE family protein [Candidatus Absconditabacterales bacterium]
MADVAHFREQLNQAIVAADIVKFFDVLLTISVEMGASDIHIEPFEHYARVRLRVDGILEELVQYPRNLHDSVISKFKIESGQMRPDEKRLPQDARVSTITQTSKEIDLRANTLPTVRGEKLCMRIVDKSKKIPPLEVLGIEGNNNKILYSGINLPNGIILTTGPTGSGKTTTLYSAISQINTVDVNITTFEDPVENKMFGLNQSQVRADIGFTFASGLRSALRQDPDIILVGEIRDHETLDMGMEAAMTGHLVFSTIHTNSAAETLTRIINLGAKGFMIAGSFNLIMAQRLVRRCCDLCSVKVNVKDHPHYERTKACFGSMDREALKQEIIMRGISPAQWTEYINEGWVTQGSGKDLHTGGVCSKCGGSGMKGRLGIYEVLDFTDDIKDLIVAEKSAMELERYALAHGLVSLERDAVLKLIKGVMPMDEIYSTVKHKSG